VARTAVVAGTASAVNGRVQRRQAERFAERDAHTAAMRQEAYREEAYAQAPPPPPPPQAAAPAVSAEERLVQLERLGGLLSQGVLTQEEFAAEKARILSS
jgi:hypothetical protein